MRHLRTARSTLCAAWCRGKSYLNRGCPAGIGNPASERGQSFAGQTKRVRPGGVSSLHMIRDHVCDMDVDERTAAVTTEYEGDTYYFCSEECKNKFVADPETYVSRTDASQT